MTEYYGWVPHLSTGLDAIFPEISPTGYTVLKRMSVMFESYSADTLVDSIDTADGPVPVEMRIGGSFYDTEHTFTVVCDEDRYEFGITVSRTGMMRITPRNVPDYLERNLSKVVYYFVKDKLHDDTHHTIIDSREETGTKGYIEVPRPVVSDGVPGAAAAISLDFIRLAHNSLMQMCRTVPYLVKLSRLEDLLFRLRTKGRLPHRDAEEMYDLIVDTGLIRNEEEIEGLSRRKLLRMVHERLQENIEKQNRLVGTLYESSKGSICYALNFGRLFSDHVDSGFCDILRNDLDSIDVLYNVHKNNEEHRMAKINERMNEIGMDNGIISKRLTIVIVSFTIVSAVFGFAVVLLGL